MISISSEFDIGSLRNFYDVYYDHDEEYSLYMKDFESEYTDWHVKATFVI